MGHPIGIGGQAVSGGVVDLGPLISNRATHGAYRFGRGEDLIWPLDSRSDGSDGSYPFAVAN